MAKKKKVGEGLKLQNRVHPCMIQCPAAFSIHRIILWLHLFPYTYAAATRTNSHTSRKSLLENPMYNGHLQGAF